MLYNWQYALPDFCLMMNSSPRERPYVQKSYFYLTLLSGLPFVANMALAEKIKFQNSVTALSSSAIKHR